MTLITFPSLFFFRKLSRWPYSSRQSDTREDYESLSININNYLVFDRVKFFYFIRVGAFIKHLLSSTRITFHHSTTRRTKESSNSSRDTKWRHLGIWKYTSGTLGWQASESTGFVTIFPRFSPRPTRRNIWNIRRPHYPRVRLINFPLWSSAGLNT